MQGFERMDRQLTDAAALAGHLVSAIRNVAREVPGAAEQIAQACTGHDCSKPGKPKIDWDDPEAKDALVSALVSDASAVVEAFRDAQLEEPAGVAAGLSLAVTRVVCMPCAPVASEPASGVSGVTPGGPRSGGARPLIAAPVDGLTRRLRADMRVSGQAFPVEKLR